MPPKASNNQSTFMRKNVTFYSRALLLTALAVSSLTRLQAQVKLSNGTNSQNLDFSASMPTSVGSNPSSAFTSAGFEPNTVAAGRLNSNAWAVTGWSDGALAFGGTRIVANTDYTRGAAAAPVVTGGIYAYTAAPHSAANPALMIQPGGSDWAPGTLTLKIENTGTTNITKLVVSYNLYNRNDQARGNSFNFSYSADDVTYTAVPALDFTSPAAADALGWVLIGNKSTTINGLSIAPGSFYYIRWSGADVNGTGSRDEFGLDDISLTATFACNLSSVGLTDVHCEDNNETGGDPSDDYIWFQLNPTGTNLGTGYNVTVSAGSVLWNGNTPATNVPYGSSQFFRLQAGSAGGGNVTVTVTDVSGNCMLSATIVDPGSCSNACNINSSGLADVACADLEETPNDPTDDYITFNLNPSGTNLGSTYSLSVSSGSVSYIGGAPAVNIPYGGTSFFRLQMGSAGAGDVVLFITDDNDPNCVLAVDIIDPGPCSVPSCSFSVVCPPNPSGTYSCNNPIPAAVTTQAGFEALGGSITGTFCGTLTITSVTSSLDNCSSSNVTRTYTIFDDLAPANGMKDANETGYTCTLTYTYTPDNVPPTVTAGSISACYSTLAAAEAAAIAATTATDNCSGVITKTASTVGSCSAVITVTAKDVCNNAASVTYNTRIDGTAPTLQGLPASPITVNCNDPLPPVANVTATDNCGPVTPAFSTASIPGNCPQNKTITRTWTATDACGNSTVFTQTINVVDVTPPVFIQSPLPANITVSCDAIPNAPTLTGTDNCDPGIPVPVIFINEIHYDNTGADVNESIEIAGTAGIDLSNYQIVLYNGTGGAPYGTTVLSGLIDNEAGGFGAVSFSYPVNGIQNGAPDGICLATTGGTVIQFLSYEGSFTAVGGVANGLVSTDIGVQEDGTNAVGTSLQLTGTGMQYSDFSWVGPIAATPGTLNVGQVINPLPGVITALFSQSIVPGSCNGESTITRMWQLKDACNNSVTHTQVITVEDNTGPSFSPPPLPMDITLSCEQPVPPAPMLTAADLCDIPGMLNERVWINEIHYDNTGADVGEFIEVAGTAGTDLSTYSLVLYNGTGGASYNTLVLSGIIPNLANGFGTVCFNYPVNGIQNGSPDGVALVHNVMGGMVVQFLSYEGVFMATDGPANGMNSVDIGVSENGSNAVGTSIYLTGNGDEYSDFTWTGPLAATNCGVNTGQTFIAVSMGPVITFTETTTPGNCPQARTITRTWTATDACGNTSTLKQVISIVDNTPPTVNCPANLTLNLDIFGNASLSLGNINFSYSDNCAPNSALTVLPFPTQFFDCDDEGTTRQVTISVKDPCGNIGTCTINVTIPPFSRCTPVVLITDPCVCKNNATTLSDGQFGETIKIESLAGKTWTVIANTGFYLAGSPAPPAAPILVPVGTVLPETPFPSGDYYLNGLHVDGLGYSITFRSETGQILTIGNACEYPNPAITADLSGPFCLFSDPVALTGTPGDAHIISQGFTINGVPATVFDPSLGVGQYKIVYTVDGGVPKAFGPNDPGCIQTITVYVNVLATPSNLACNDLVYISLDDATCALDILPDMILEGTYNCYDDYFVELDKTLPYGNGPWVPGSVNASDIGKTYQVRVTHLVSGVKCWGNVKIEDKESPVITCQNFSVPCNTPNLTADYLFNTKGILAAYPVVTDCQNFTLSYIDAQSNSNCASGLSKIITRKWTAVDASGNSSVCTQTIGLIRPTLADVTLPPDYDGFDAPGFNCTADYPTPDWIESQGKQGYPYVFGQPSGCNINWEWHDFKIVVCEGTYKIRRDWTIIDWCTGDGFTLSQLIKVEDKQGPSMACPANTTVSINPFQCCGTIDMPDIIVEDGCSRVNNISGMVVTFDPFTNEQTGMYTFGGTLKDFPGNNWWDKDTLAAFGLTPCLPIGNQVVTYIATDDCGNSTTCSFKMSVQDLIPPVAACDQFTTVALTADGTAEVNATTFDDGSYDACAPVYFKARRMDSNSCQSNGTFHDAVTFCCEDVGVITTVILRVYDVPIATGDVSTSFQENHANDCMVQVEVQDKIKPTCIPPVNVSVDCENFDPSLWAYGIPEIADNCCLDDSKEYQGQEGLTHSVNYSLFDTVCNRGTITRTFRAFDCYGQSSQCTQRVFVSYLQDYSLRFPNDMIVTVCEDSARWDEPKMYGEDCELLGVSYEDEIFTVVPDACMKIERTWTVINWCTYNPNGPCIYVPNPNPNPNANNILNLPGPTVSAPGTLPPWKSTVVKINPTDPAPTDFSTFWNANANCYKYKQIIKLSDGLPPSGTYVAPNCDNQNWLTPNQPQFWNEMYWWDNSIGTHDLCEEPTDLCITGTDACSGVNINIEYLLFLDLDGDGVMETVINSVNTGIAGLGWNNVLYNNLNTPNFGGGTPRAFDERAVPANQKYGFAIQETIAGNKKTACVRWNTQQNQNTFVTPELPHGTHKIKWFLTDGCGNNKEYEYTFTVKDCKAPTVVCINGLSVNIMPTGMIQLWASDFLQYAEDNCTPAGQLKIGIRKCGTGTGFPVDANGNPITSVSFNCTELGTQCVEIWAMDAAGNADYCETYIIVQDNLGNCTPADHINVGGKVETEMTAGVEEAVVHINGSSNFSPPYSFFDLSDADGNYQVMNNVPLASTFTIAPEKDDNPLNGVTTYDLVLISQHILGTQPLDSPYKIIAADANKSNSITTFDILELRKLILGIYTDLPNNKSWRFVDHAFVFPNPNNPFETAFPESISVATALSDHMHEDFMGLKVGDVNDSCIPNLNTSSEERSSGTTLFDIQDQDLKAGEVFDVTFKANETLAGFQFTILLDGLEMLGWSETGPVTANNFGKFDQAVTVSIDQAQEFTLRFRAANPGKLSKMLTLSGSITRAEAYVTEKGEMTKRNVALRFGSPTGASISGVGFELYQNQPNPFINKTNIGFYLPEASEATLTVLDESGRKVYQQKGQFAAGVNNIVLDRALLNTSGVLYYQLSTASESAVRKMIQGK